ncbi:hypothetical protein PR202_ga08750 [Eleusine coracana subsp. coracana]|uniref:Uncharacterized protein n=1 Tax=Eleusine coracana subsp. coracana TaxID=191504 RepID=A0AAV5C0S4_ELECO|nr:hypothetical protein PR202_ga08750 [Eleusine coracana subsp. coracana]
MAEKREVQNFSGFAHSRRYACPADWSYAAVVFTNEGRRIGDCYTHVGEELALDFLNLRDLAGVHDLATYVASLRAEACCQQKQAGNNGAKDARGVLARGMEFAFTA